MDQLIPGATRTSVSRCTSASRALRGDPPQDEVTAVEATDEGLHATFEGARATRCSTGCSSPSAAGPTAARGRRRRRRRGRRPRLHPGRRADAHQRVPHLRHRRRGRRADARPQGLARGQGRRRGDRRPRRRLRRSRPSCSVACTHAEVAWMGSDSETKAKAVRHRVREGGRSPVELALRAHRSGRSGRARRSCCWSRRRTVIPRRRHLPASTRANCLAEGPCLAFELGAVAADVGAHHPLASDVVGDGLMSPPRWRRAL